MWPSAADAMRLNCLTVVVVVVPPNTGCMDFEQLFLHMEIGDLPDVVVTAAAAVAKLNKLCMIEERQLV